MTQVGGRRRSSWAYLNKGINNLLSLAKKSENAEIELLLDSLEVKYVRDGICEFTPQIHKTLRENCTDNVIYSPFNVGLLFAMLSIGGHGKVSSEIKNAFRLHLISDEALVIGFSQMFRATKDPCTECILENTVKICCPATMKCSYEFLYNLNKFFQTDLHLTDYTNRLVCSIELNHFVQETCPHIPGGIIAQSDIRGDESLLLFTTTYFKGFWETRFNARLIQKAKFFLSSGQQVEVDMMQKESSFPYAANLHELEARALALPYKGQRMVMLVILPMGMNGLSLIESKLHEINTIQLLETMKKDERMLLVSLPKFRMETKMEMSGPLKRLGLNTAFETTTSELKGISATWGKPIYISKIFHRVVFEVNEEGTGPTAATKKMMIEQCNRVVTPFNINKPFYFQVIDQKSNCILLSGSCTNPLENSE